MQNNVSQKQLSTSISFFVTFIVFCKPAQPFQFWFVIAHAFRQNDQQKEGNKEFAF